MRQDVPDELPGHADRAAPWVPAIAPRPGRYGPLTLAEAREHPLEATFTAVDNGLGLISTIDLTFAGYDGAPVHAWLHVPAGERGPLPAVVEYVGYGGGRGPPHERVMWAAAGYAHVVMDTRGQGSTWSVGPDLSRRGSVS